MIKVLNYSNVKIIFCFFSLLNFELAFGWGLTGHRIVGLIAEKNLTKESKEELRRIFKTKTLPMLANWADSIKSDPKWDRARPWHYVTIEDGQTYKTSPKNPKGDVIWAINHFRNIIKNEKSADWKKKEAILFLSHFVGDIHNPLHVGHAHDKGGNTLGLKWFGKWTNFHRLWDEDMIDHNILSYTEYVDHIYHPRILDLSEFQTEDIFIWVKECMTLRTEIYSKLKEVDAIKGKKYWEFRYKFLTNEILNQQLVKAGVRLAHLLNINLKPSIKK